MRLTQRKLGGNEELNNFVNIKGYIAFFLYLFFFNLESFPSVSARIEHFITDESGARRKSNYFY